MMKPQSVHDSISKLLTERLSRRKGQKLNRAACIEIYNDVFFTLSEVVKTAGTPLSNESINLLAQMYYDSITINANEELDPNIFTQRAQPGNIPTKELVLMAVMMNGTPFGDLFVSEVKRRS